MLNPHSQMYSTHFTCATCSTNYFAQTKTPSRGRGFHVATPGLKLQHGKGRIRANIVALISVASSSLLPSLAEETLRMPNASPASKLIVFGNTCQVNPDKNFLLSSAGAICCGGLLEKGDSPTKNNFNFGQETWRLPCENLIFVCGSNVETTTTYPPPVLGL